MDSEEITSILKENSTTRRYFGGVLASDKLPASPQNRNFPRKYLYYVVNFDRDEEEGSHWVVCFFNHSSRHSYFDSYGFPPVIDSIKDFMGDKYDYDYNSEQVQHPLSTACGQWCIFFIWYQIMNKELQEEKIIEKFDKKDLLKNDHEINHWVNSRFNKKHQVLDKTFLKRQIARSQIENLDKFSLL